jgi:hypothetical protein
MTAPEFLNNDNQYNLDLPPIAEAHPQDEPAAHLLANPDIRAGLQVVNDSISGQLDQLRQNGGQVVHELVRGTTAAGLGIAVARYAEAGTPEAAAFEAAQPGERVLSGSAPIVVFMYSLQDLTPEGAPRADEPWDLVPIPATRAGLSIGIVTGGGTSRMSLNIPPVHLQGRPTLNGAEIVGFREAAAGERRMAAIKKSVDWIGGKMLAAGREGDGDTMAQLYAYKQEKIHEATDHLEWVDDPPTPEQLLPGIEEYLAAHREALPYPTKDIGQHAKYMRYDAASYIRKHDLIDPEEIAVVAEVMMPDVIIVDPPAGETIQSERYLNSYYKRGRDYAGGRDGVVERALEAHRAAKMAAAS